MRAMIFLAAVVFSAGTSHAATFNVNIDATQNVGVGSDTAKYLSLFLLSGDYKITAVDSPYLAWRFNNEPITGCDASGENCYDSGFVWDYAVATAADGNILDVFAGNPFETASAAFAAAEALGPQFFTLAQDAFVLFGVHDGSTSGADNSGGVSLLVETVGDIQVVPLPASLPLLLAGLGGILAAGRRNKKAS